jgi:hypothetical protein
VRPGGRNFSPLLQMAKPSNVSAGLLLVRRPKGELEVFLAHPRVRGGDERPPRRTLLAAGQRPPEGRQARARLGLGGGGRSAPGPEQYDACRMAPRLGAMAHLPRGGPVRMVRCAQRAAEDQSCAIRADRSTGGCTLVGGSELELKSLGERQTLPTSTGAPQRAT